MNIWRMKLRQGSHGPNMWPQCEKRRIAAITYPPIRGVDLTNKEPSDIDLAVKTSARTSIWRFAWEIVGGDIILVGDSDSKRIIAKGYVDAPLGKRAYRYNNKSPIVTPNISNRPSIPWRHEVPVKWKNQSDFEPFEYKDGAPRITVMHYDPMWEKGIHPSPFVELDGQAPLLNENPYIREITEDRKHIDRLHAAFSNNFRQWLKRKYGINATQEHDHMDLQFTHLGKTHMAELKICYGQNTKRAIRAALGQVFEYNCYPPKKAKGTWLIVLDQEPSKDDLRYIASLRKQFSVPLIAIWSAKKSFDCDKAIFSPHRTSVA